MKISNKKRRFIEQARKIAATSEYLPHRHGALLIKGSSVISYSPNKNKFNSFAQRFCSHDGPGTIHAELGCILGVDNSITKNSTIYVVRINRENVLKNSKPCSMCLACMEFVGIRKVYYSVSEEHIGCIKINNENFDN